MVCSWPGSALGILEGQMEWRGTIRHSVTVMRISAVTGGKAGYHIRRYP